MDRSALYGDLVATRFVNLGVDMSPRGSGERPVLTPCLGIGNVRIGNGGVGICGSRNLWESEIVGVGNCGRG
jgi:hypothetical protein